MASKASEAAYKAWSTRRHRAAAKKAWRTMHKRERKMTPAELKELHLKRSRAAKQAWVTMRKAA